MTLAQTVKIGVRPEVAGFVVPLCATIHLSGSMMKIVACSLAVMMLSGLDVSMGTYSGFILLLGITMIAAPGVPGGAIMAAIGLLESMLGFDENMIGLMIATYIAMDSFGTATNVNGRRCDRGDRKRHRQPNDSPGKTINLLLIFSHSKKIFNFASIVHKRTTAVK